MGEPLAGAVLLLPWLSGGCAVLMIALFARKYGIGKAKDALIGTLQSTVNGLQAEVASLTRQLSESNLRVKHLEELLASEKDRHIAEIRGLHGEFEAKLAQTQAETIKYRNQVSVLVQLLRKDGAGSAAAEVIGQIMDREDEQERLHSTGVAEKP